MTKRFLGVLIPFFMAAMLITSCDKESEVVTTTEDYIDMEITDREGGVFGAPYGKNRCFHILFPYTIEFEDGTQFTAENREELHTALKEWRAANPDATVRPKPVFPFTVEFRDGTTMEVTNADDLASIRSTCEELLSDHPIRPRPHRTCFKLVFPLSVDFPDDADSIEVGSAAEFRALLKEWRESNEGNLDRPELIYPIQVTMKKTDEVVTINSFEELKELHRTCHG